MRRINYDDMKEFLMKLLLKPEVRRGKLPEKQFYDAMSKAYQNPAIMEYLNDREQYLIQNGMERFIAGDLNESRGLAGQLIEIRSLKTRMKACYNVRHKEQLKRRAPKSAT
jgi:hypothetical protein